MSKIITFSESAKAEILDSFNMAVNLETGYIVEKNNSQKIVLSPEGDPLEFRNFAGIKKGSLVFVKSDITSLINLSDTLK
ncbi:MAG: hypothetical protein PHO03_05670 [Candidatus Omnitrophica bacterium]|nr:hypothetical protein [Candidatus Omnitrophota bacterium]